jgi:hypothetical protein
MRDKYFLAWGRDADENGPERDDTIGKIVSIESFFVELEIFSVNGHDIGQECTILSSLDELELRDTVFFKTLTAAKDHYKKVRAALRPRKLGSTGVEIRWSISGRLDLSGANLSLPAAASRPVPASAATR